MVLKPLEKLRKRILAQDEQNAIIQRFCKEINAAREMKTELRAEIDVAGQSVGAFLKRVEDILSQELFTSFEKVVERLLFGIKLHSFPIADILKEVTSCDVPPSKCHDILGHVEALLKNDGLTHPLPLEIAAALQKAVAREGLGVSDLWNFEQAICLKFNIPLTIILGDSNWFPEKHRNEKPIHSLFVAKPSLTQGEVVLMLRDHVHEKKSEFLEELYDEDEPDFLLYALQSGVPPV